MAKRPNAPVVVLHIQPDSERNPRRVFSAVFFSFMLNAVIITLFFLSNTFRATAVPGDGDSDTSIVMPDEPEAPPLNLDREELGLEPDKEKANDSPRIEDQVFSGVTVADLDPGIQGNPAERMTGILPPAGVARIDGNIAMPEGPTLRERSLMNAEKGGGFDARMSASTRFRAVANDGGNAFSEAAVASGLHYLALHQGKDGRWSFKDFAHHGKCNCTGQSNHDDIAATAFGLLPFLGAGQTHKGGSASGNRYTKEVDAALKYLVLRQNREGEFHPLMYSQGLATMAVCEAYALTSDPSLRGPAQRAVNYIVDAQSAEGGWRYARRQAGYDTSVSGWQLMALKSGQMAGLNVPASAFTRCKKWLDAAGTPDGGAYGYCERGEGANTTAVGLLSREYLGWGPRNPGLIAGVKRLQTWKPQPSNMYFSYYATQVMHHAGGTAWDQWNPAMRDGLIAAQDKGLDPQHPHHKGSWMHAGSYAGRLMDTSLSILTLEVYYRHLPLYRRDVGNDKALLQD